MNVFLILTAWVLTTDRKMTKTAIEFTCCKGNNQCVIPGTKITLCKIFHLKETCKLNVFLMSQIKMIIRIKYVLRSCVLFFKMWTCTISPQGGSAFLCIASSFIWLKTEGFIHRSRVIALVRYVHLWIGDALNFYLMVSKIQWSWHFCTFLFSSDVHNKKYTMKHTLFTFLYALHGLFKDMAVNIKFWGDCYYCGTSFLHWIFHCFFITQPYNFIFLTASNTLLIDGTHLTAETTKFIMWSHKKSTELKLFSK